MNDIYEQKAKKYKYKYLELKRSIELEGGWEWSDYFGNWLSKKPIVDPKVAEEQVKNTKRTEFKNILKSIKTNIESETNLKQLYNKEILGNIDNTIIKDDQIVFDMTKKISIITKPEVVTPGGVTTDEVKDQIKEIVKNYPSYVPPIIKCYFELNEESTRKQLLKFFYECLIKNELKEKKLDESSRNNIGGIYCKNLEIVFESLKNDNVPNNLFNIYKLFIRNFEKDIDYYALTKVICDKFKDYKEYNLDLKVIKSNSLNELFIIFENHFYNNTLTKDIFLEQLNNIIDALT